MCFSVYIDTEDQIMKARTEQYSTRKYLVYTMPPYPYVIGHIVRAHHSWLAESGPTDLGYFKTKAEAVKAIINANREN